MSNTPVKTIYHCRIGISLKKTLNLETEIMSNFHGMIKIILKLIKIQIIHLMFVNCQIKQHPLYLCDKYTNTSQRI